MALDDFSTSDEYSEGNVKTRKKPENISIGEDEWKWLMLHDPSWAEAWGRQCTVKEAKALVQMMDELLAGDETQYGKASDEQKEDIRKYREDLIEYIKENDE